MTAMKLIIHSSLWGRMYRNRHYVNGRRVTELAFDAEYSRLGFKAEDARVERGGGFHRYIWEQAAC